MPFFKSPVHETESTTETDDWNDLYSVGKLTNAIEHGAVAATTNPTSVRSSVRTGRVDQRVYTAESPYQQCLISIVNLST